MDKVSWVIYLVNRGDKSELKALSLARKLRKEGFAVELDNSGSSFGKQFKKADRCGATWAIVLGDDEISNEEISLKRLNKFDDFHGSKEQKISSSDLDMLITLLQG